jgi:hypothetical protein
MILSIIYIFIHNKLYSQSAQNRTRKARQVACASRTTFVPRPTPTRPLRASIPLSALPRSTNSLLEQLLRRDAAVGNGKVGAASRVSPKQQMLKRNEQKRKIFSVERWFLVRYNTKCLFIITNNSNK